MTMTVFRFLALLAAVGGGAYLLRLVHRRKLSGGEFLLWLALVLSVIALSLIPQLLAVFFEVVTLAANSRYDRLSGLAFLGLGLAFALILYYRNKLQHIQDQFLTHVQAEAVERFVRSHGRTTADIVVLIPAFNEAGSIAAVLQGVPSSIRGLGVRTVVVSDGSTDGTDSIAERFGALVVRHPSNYGQGMALQTGYRCASVVRATYAVTLDADGQYRPDEIERVLTPLMLDRADIVSGSRLLGYYEQEFARHHRLRSLGVHLFNGLLGMMTGLRITDSASGFRAIRVSKLAGMTFSQPQFHSSELLLEALKRNLRFEEVPISFLKRASGETKKPPAFQYGLGVLRTVVFTWVRR